MLSKFTLLAAGLLVAFTTEAETDLQIDQHSCESLLQALDKSGWTISRTDQGDIILLPKATQEAGNQPIFTPGTEQPANASPVPEIQDTVIDFATLPGRLEKAGWVVEKDDAGSLKIHWPESSETDAPVNASENASIDALRQTLQRSGWDVDKTPGGDLLLYPDGVRRDSTDESEGGKVSGSEASRGASSTQQTTDLATLQRKLESAGLITSRDNNGDLKVYWSEPETTDRRRSFTENSGQDLEYLIPLLKNTGWQVERGKNGDLLLYPADPAPAPSSKAAQARIIQPVDSDSDGVPDESDLCPGSAIGEHVNTIGCAEGSLVLEGVSFKSGSSQLTPTAKKFLAAQADRMSRHSGLQFKITGHTDSAGTARKNQSLSEKRARAVFNYLILMGVDEKSMNYSGAGESRPIASNSTASGRKKNRRVELFISHP